MDDAASTSLLDQPASAGPQQSSHPARRAVYALVAIFLGQAIWLAKPGFNILAMVLVCLSILLCAIGIAAPVSRKPQTSKGEKILLAILGMGIVLGFFHVPLISLYIRFPAARPSLFPFVSLAAFAVVLIAVMLLTRSRALATACFLLLIAVYGCMGVWYLTLSTDPQIDVYQVQHLAAQTLVRGHDPFAITFPDIYHEPGMFYPPSLVVNGQVQCGYCYPPLTLLLDVPGHLAGDVRYTQLFCLLFAALLIGFMRPSRVNYAAATLLLFTPNVFLLLENAWIEPQLVMLLAAAVFVLSIAKPSRSGDKSGRSLFIAAIFIGLFLAAKQYAPLALAAVWLILPRPINWRQTLRLALVALSAGIIVTLPFILWSPHAFFRSMTVLHVGSLRMDSLSFAPVIWHVAHYKVSLALAAMAAIPASVLVIWRAPRTPGAFAAATALILMCVFAMSPESFGNYYFLASGALCCAAAA